MFNFISSKATSVFHNVANKIMNEDETDEKDPAQDIIMAAKKGMKSTFAGKEDSKKVNEGEEIVSVIKEFNEYKKSSLEREANLNKEVESLRAENELLKRGIGVPEEIDNLFNEVNKEIQGDGKAKIEELRKKIESVLKVEDVGEVVRRKEEIWRLRFKIVANNLREIKEKLTDDISEIKSQMQQIVNSTITQLLKYFLFAILDFAL